MPDWNSQPPRGGPMVDVAFLGPWYPPDAAEKGKTPSPPGPYAIGLKRTLGHLGAWPWDPDGYDETYSNDFAHGSSRGPGVAGVQRWAKLEPTGWIGTATFNFLRSVLIQEWKEHAGEHAIDAYSVPLLETVPPPPKPAKQPRELALQHMQARLGYTENPANSNCDSRPDGIRTAQDHCAGGGTWLRYEPWCGCWCYYALETAGVTKIDSHLASVAQIEDYARKSQKCYRGWTTDPSKARPGDLVIIGGYGQHVEMARAQPTSSSTATYGGNTSPGTSGSQSNGGGAYARTRYPSEVRGYALVRFPGE